MRNVRLRITDASPARRRSSGMIVPSTISFISYGTPGTAKMTFASASSSEPPTGHISPGAVPGIWAMIAPPAGTSAWRRLFSGNDRPRDSNIARILSSSSGSRTSSTPMTSAMTSRVMSSWVGPRPPHTMTASDRSSAMRSAEAMRSALSPTLVWNIESMPASASCSPMNDELVSTIWPSSSSVPTATTSQRMRGI